MLSLFIIHSLFIHKRISFVFVHIFPFESVIQCISHQNSFKTKYNAYAYVCMDACDGHNVCVCGFGFVCVCVSVCVCVCVFVLLWNDTK